MKSNPAKAVHPGAMWVRGNRHESRDGSLPGRAARGLALVLQPPCTDHVRWWAVFGGPVFSTVVRERGVVRKRRAAVVMVSEAELLGEKVVDRSNNVVMLFARIVEAWCASDAR